MNSGDTEIVNIDDGYNMYRSYNNGIVVYIDNTLSVACSQLLLAGVPLAYLRPSTGLEFLVNFLLF